MRPSDLYHGNPYDDKTVSLYWIGPLNFTWMSWYHLKKTHAHNGDGGSRWYFMCPLDTSWQALYLMSYISLHYLGVSTVTRCSQDVAPSLAIFFAFIISKGHKAIIKTLAYNKTSLSKLKPLSKTKSKKTVLCGVELPVKMEKYSSKQFELSDIKTNKSAVWITFSHVNQRVSHTHCTWINSEWNIS